MGRKGGFLMKKFLMIFIIIILSITYVSVNAGDLADIQRTGKMTLGVPPEYIPFVFYDNTGKATGIDVALMQEIARRMGVELQVYNLAFEGLIDSLNLGQVDVIGGAISKTPDREKEVDFTRVYYMGDAQFIALSSMGKPGSINLESFRNYKIGVQKGTSFDQWVKTNLVSAGYVSARDVYSYSSASDEIKALDRGDIHLAVLDQDVYEGLYKSSGKYQIFYDGFMKENYAFGFRKNSDLTSVVNGHLTDMIKDGTAQSIANRFFQMNFGEVKADAARPSSIPTPTPNIPVYVIPAQTVSSCRNSMTFVSDVTITDGHQVYSGERFTKVWRVRNTGTCTWDTNYTFVFVSGDQMSGRNISIPAIVQPNQTIDLSVDLVAPNGNGTYRGYWQMRSPQGQNFGESIWVKVRVNGGGSGGSSGGLSINAFYPDYYSGGRGTCPTVYWQTSNASVIDIYVDNVAVSRSYSSNGAQQICGALMNPGSHTVQLAASSSANTVYSSFVFTTRNEEEGQRRVVPVINYFYPETNSGPEGNCVTVYWSVSNAGMMDVDVDGEVVKSSTELNATRTICGAIAYPGHHTVTLTAHSVTDDARSSFSYTTSEEGQRRVVPVIEYFDVNPTWGVMGDTTTASWSVSNAASVDITVDGNYIERNQSPNGSCTIQATIQSVGVHEIRLIAHSVTDDVSSTVYFNMGEEDWGGFAGSNYGG